jgi:uncharacterized protein with FMN-binding domain
MKRIVLWILSTVSCLVLLFGYHTSTSRTLATSSPTSVQAPVTASSSSTSGSSAAGSSGSSGSSESSGSSTNATKTVTGSVASTRWGPVQVQLTVVAGKITKVAVVQYPSGNPKDMEINDYALPVLTQETLDAQSANIDMISGATVTSTGYVQSLQSAIDQAGL